AHTAGHISYYLPANGVIFVGDTLFAMGCGRLFEGTAEQMFANMQRYADLPDATAVYCAHEYTQSNGRYALTAEPGNAALKDRMAMVDRA
ncbi:MBL fold metallo-hydrolase, partial [Acinetobacter baumannii]